MKNIENNEIEFGNDIIGKGNQKFDLSLQLRSHKERFNVYAMTIVEYNIIFSLDWH